MKNEILKYEGFSLFFGVLSKKHFELSPIWCEYYESSELDACLSEDWLNTNVFLPMAKSNTHPYYSSSKKMDYAKKEYINVNCELIIEKYELQGYLFISAGNINAITIFLGSDMVDLYSSELLSDDNCNSIKEVERYLGISLFGTEKISYKIKNINLNFVPSMGVFEFPVN